MNFFQRLFHKPEVKPIPPLPTWEEIVGLMYDTGLDCADAQVVRVMYSEDRAMRYVVVKDHRGIYTYYLEAICPFDEDEWKCICQNEDALPAMWETPVGSQGGSHLFANEVDLLKALRAEPEYQQYFCNEDTPTCIRFLFDYGAYSCLWGENGEGLLSMDSFLISRELRDTLERLSVEYNSILNWDDPASGFVWTAEEIENFRARAQQAYEELVSQLGDTYQVRNQIALSLGLDTAE